MGTKLKILLVVSLILNVFLVGTAAGVLLVRGRLAEVAGPPGLRGPEGPPMRGMQALGPERRGAFREAMRGRMDRFEPRLRAVRDARQAVQDEFAKPVFDPAAARAAMAQARAAEDLARAEVENATVDFAAKLSPEERKAMGLGMGGGRGGPMLMHFRHGPDGRGPDGPPPPPPPRPAP